jgi:hypothetical protein
VCIFSSLVSSVANTNIFARSSIEGKQFLVYRMQYEADSELAMILPLPTPALPPEDAVRFIDLSGYPEFFTDMFHGFPIALTRGQAAAAAIDGSATLKVHEVGSFHASFVPHQRDFARLDSRFRLPDQTWAMMPQYKDYAFAVFKLQAGARNVHPMAFEFPRRNSRELFFPTVHVHDGVVTPDAWFDHSLYSQRPLLQGKHDWSSPFEDTFVPASEFMDIGRTQGIVDADTTVQRRTIYGLEINRDILIDEERDADSL